MKIKKYIVYKTQLDTLKTVCGIYKSDGKRNYMLEDVVEEIERQEIKPRKRKENEDENL